MTGWMGVHWVGSGARAQAHARTARPCGRARASSAREEPERQIREAGDRGEERCKWQEHNATWGTGRGAGHHDTGNSASATNGNSAEPQAPPQLLRRSMAGQL